ncbi:MAG: ATP-binding protein, partial [Halapricum sp.]
MSEHTDTDGVPDEDGSASADRESEQAVEDEVEESPSDGDESVVEATADEVADVDDESHPVETGSTTESETGADEQTETDLGSDVSIEGDEATVAEDEEDLLGGLDVETTEEIEVPDRLVDQVIGQDHARDIVKKAAKQRRHVMMIGSPGTGKSMLAKAMSQLLPKEDL